MEVSDADGHGERGAVSASNPQINLGEINSLRLVFKGAVRYRLIMSDLSAQI